MSTIRTRQFRKEDYSGLLDAEPRFADFLTSLNQQQKQVETVLNGGILFSDNARGFLREVTFTAPDFIAPTLTNGFANVGGFAPAGYIRRGPEVTVKATLNGGTPSTSIFTLPVGYRPAEKFSGAADGFGATHVELTFNTDGTITSSSATCFFYASFLTVDPPVSVLSVKLKNTLPSKPLAISIANASDISNGSPGTPVALGGVAWTLTADQIVVTEVLGTGPGRKYRAVFRVEAS